MGDILVVQLARTGDFLQTAPLLSALKADAHTVTLSVLVDKRVEETARRCACADNIFTIDTSLLDLLMHQDNASAEELYSVLTDVSSHIRSLHFDRIINLNCSMVSAVLSSLPECSSISGYYISPRSRNLVKDPFCIFFNTAVCFDRLAPYNLADCFRLIGGMHSHRSNMCYTPFQEDRDEAQKKCAQLGIRTGDIVVALQLGTGHRLRTWPPAYFARCASGLLKNERIKCILFGTAQDAASAQECIECIGAQSTDDIQGRIFNLTGRTSLPALAALLERCSLLIAGDTGAMHLAAAVGCPQLALFFGPAYLHHTAPYDHKSVVIATTADCSPCSESMRCDGERCRNTIPPELVSQAAISMLLNRHLPACDHNNADIYVPGFDSQGIVYMPASRRALTYSEMRNLCYRSIGACLHGFFCSTGSEPHRPHALIRQSGFHIDEYLKKSLEEIAASGLPLSAASHCSIEQCMLKSLEEEMSFWRPWITCCHEIRSNIGDAGGAFFDAGTLLRAGVREGIAFLKQHAQNESDLPYYTNSECTSYASH